MLNECSIYHQSTQSQSREETKVTFGWHWRQFTKKKAKVKPDGMKKTLMVRFTDIGELGADAGALKKEFFEDAIKEVNCRLFEGEDDNHFPKEWSLQFLFEVSL